MPPRNNRRMTAGSSSERSRRPTVVPRSPSRQSDNAIVREAYERQKREIGKVDVPARSEDRAGKAQHRS
jgi:hypothetical protein